MTQQFQRWLEVELCTPEQMADLWQRARERHWGVALILIGWLHLFAFLGCYYFTIVLDYHEATPYLTLWFGELLGMWLIFRCCAWNQPRGRGPVLESFIRRVWLAYFLLAFNLASMNTLRGHEMFELFPAMASLGSFAFLMLTIVLSWRFFGAVLILFASGLLMATFFWHAFLIFAIAWWLVLNGIGWHIWQHCRVHNRQETKPEKIENDSRFSHSHS